MQTKTLNVEQNDLKGWDCVKMFTLKEMSENEENVSAQ